MCVRVLLDLGSNFGTKLIIVLKVIVNVIFGTKLIIVLKFIVKVIVCMAASLFSWRGILSEQHSSSLWHTNLSVSGFKRKDI